MDDFRTTVLPFYACLQFRVTRLRAKEVPPRRAAQEKHFIFRQRKRQTRIMKLGRGVVAK